MTYQGKYLIIQYDLQQISGVKMLKENGMFVGTILLAIKMLVPLLKQYCVFLYLRSPCKGTGSEKTPDFSMQ